MVEVTKKLVNTIFGITIVVFVMKIVKHVQKMGKHVLNVNSLIVNIEDLNQLVNVWQGVMYQKQILMVNLHQQGVVNPVPLVNINFSLGNMNAYPVLKVPLYVEEGIKSKSKKDFGELPIKVLSIKNV